MFAKKTLVEGLPSDEHTLKILKRTMSSADYAVIKNLSSDGAFLGAPEKPKLHIAFYGDSITCGSGVLREYKPADSKIHTAETQNALQSYAAYCAIELGASFGGRFVGGKRRMSRIRFFRYARRRGYLSRNQRLSAQFKQQHRVFYCGDGSRLYRICR